MHDALIAQGNNFLRAGKLREAAFIYLTVEKNCPALATIAQFNLSWLEQQYLKPKGQALADFAAPYAFLPEGIFTEQLALLGKAVQRQAIEARFFDIEQKLNAAKLAPGPLISVILPVPNNAAALLASAQSVLQQSYLQWELLVCGNGDTFGAAQLLAGLNDNRVRYLQSPTASIATARNLGLSQAKGEIVTYLAGANLWHPHYLQLVCLYFSQQPGQLALYFDGLGYAGSQPDAAISVLTRSAFCFEEFLQNSVVDLNTFAHRAELYRLFGGVASSQVSQAVDTAVLKYTWLKDPLHIPLSVALKKDIALRQNLALRLGNEHHAQINSQQSPPPVNAAEQIQRFLKHGLPLQSPPATLKVSVIIWDCCRNHFSKAYAVAEALASHYQVELIAFDFFAEGVFSPLQNAQPPFAVKYLAGGFFPDFFTNYKAALQAISGDVLYVVKPRLPSMGLALLANAQRGVPFVLEINDLETVVNSPGLQQAPAGVALAACDVTDPELLNPYSDLWSLLLDPLAKQLPFLASHNKNLDRHYQFNTMPMRNIKDEAVYNPANFNREQIRAELGYTKEDRVILFGGLIRKHKGVFELVELLQQLNDNRYKVLFVASRVTPEQQQLLAQHSAQIKMLSAQDRLGMAKINFAADLVVLWLNPAVAASHYQFPYKATDAFAMGTPVIANDISDLGDLARQGYLTEVPFADWQAMRQAIDKLFADTDYRNQQVTAARRLFLRQFSYNAARANFAYMLQRMQSKHGERAGQLQPAVYDVSIEFAAFFERFYQHLSGRTGFL